MNYFWENFIGNWDITKKFGPLEGCQNELEGIVHQFKFLYTMQYSSIFAWYANKICVRTKFDWLPQDQPQKSNNVVVRNMSLFPTTMT